MHGSARLAVLCVGLPVLLWAGEAAPKPPFEAVITSDRVYIRGGDGINYTVLTVASRGDRVSVTGQRFSWLSVRVPRNCTVWVHKSMLEVAADGKQATLARDRVNVRARPHLEGDILGQLPRGAQVQVVDEDGEWAGIEPPAPARAWVHRKFVRKVAAAEVTPKATTKAAAGRGLDRAAGLGLLRQAQAAYVAELSKKPGERTFTEVLSTYQRVAAECGDEAVARRAEQARQRLLKIVDLHETLRGLREPLQQFEQKYDALEKEYKRRAEPPGEASDE